MYAPSAFAMSQGACRELIATGPAGLVVTFSPDDGFDAATIPLLLDDDRIVGHVARANPLWKRPGSVLVVFTSIDGYVSPSWYASKHENEAVVPTWNYVSVHVHGTMHIQDDHEWKRWVVTRLTDHHEAQIGSNWQVTDAPSEFIDRMLHGIVGIEISIDRMEGKAKLSQNRSTDDILGVIAANPGALGDAVAKASGLG